MKDVVVLGSSSQPISIQDEGTAIVQGVSSINFVGAGVSATASGSTATVTISGGTAASDITVQDEGTAVTTALRALNFVGSGVSATASAGTATVTIPSGATVTNSTPQSTSNANAVGTATDAARADHTHRFNAPLVATALTGIAGDMYRGTKTDGSNPNLLYYRDSANVERLLLNATDNLANLANAATARGNLGLGNVDNTNDASKPISTATQTALNGKVDTSTYTAHVGSGGSSHAAATTTVAGFMSATDKTKLDGVAANANNYVHPNHTGDVTSTGDGATVIAANAVTTAKILNSNVTYAKIQNVSATNRLLGRVTAGAGVIEELSVVPAAVMPALTGDVTTSAGTVATTIANGAVTGAKIATLVAGDAAKLQAPVRAINEIVGTQAAAVIDETLGRIQSRTLSADQTLAATGHTISDGNVISFTVLASGANRNLVFPATMDSRTVRANSLTITTASGKYRTISIMRIGADIHVDAGAEK